MALTFGQLTAPNNITTYLDSVFSLSLANYRKTLTDNIGSTNSVLYDLMKSDAYESAEGGGTYFAEDLMYGLAPADWYSGYDTLSTAPTDGITQAQFQWAQMASPITYNMKEVIQNEKKIIDLVKSRIKQSEMGIQEAWAQAFLWGNYPNGGAITTPRQSPVTSALGINPLPQLVSYNTSGSSGTALTVGGLSEYSNAWWQNHSVTSAATTYSNFMLELESLYNTCALGTGGPPTHMLMDQVTYQNFIHAYFSVYKASPDALDNAYPFVGKKFLNAKVIMDDKIPDVYTGAPGTESGGVVASSSLAYGSCIVVNSKFFKIRYHPDRDFEPLKDENGKWFVKPINGDYRVGHIAWMGQVTINNRRKQGVLGKIARSYAS
jgi:hypothetical protein